GRYGAVAIVDQRSALERRFEVEVAVDVLRVLVDAARQQLAIPRRHPHDERKRDRNRREARDARASRDSAPHDHDAGGNHQQEAHGAKGVLKTNRGIAMKPAASDPPTAATVLTA